MRSVALVVLCALGISCQERASSATDVAYAIDIEIFLSGWAAEQGVTLTWADGEAGEVVSLDRVAALRRTFATREEADEFSGAFEVTIGDSAPSSVVVQASDCDFVEGAGFDPSQIAHLVRRFEVGDGAPEDATSWAWRPARSCYREIQPIFPGTPNSWRRMLFMFPTVGPLTVTQDDKAIPVAGVGAWGDRYLYEIHLDWALDIEPATAASSLSMAVDDVDIGEIEASFAGCLSVGEGWYAPADLRRQRLALSMETGDVLINTNSGCTCEYLSGVINSYDACGTL